MTTTTDSKIMSLIENIGSCRFDVLELFDQYCIEPKNKEVKRRVKSMMEDIMNYSEEILSFFSTVITISGAIILCAIAFVIICVIIQLF